MGTNDFQDAPFCRYISIVESGILTFIHTPRHQTNHSKTVICNYIEDRFENLKVDAITTIDEILRRYNSRSLVYESNSMPTLDVLLVMLTQTSYCSIFHYYLNSKVNSAWSCHFQHLSSRIMPVTLPGTYFLGIPVAHEGLVWSSNSRSHSMLRSTVH